MKSGIYGALWILIAFGLINYSSLAIMKPDNSYVDITVAVFAFFGVKAVMTSFENFYYWFNGRE
ncbi:hypothetical protein [Serratia liquefaciens]|uniref:hypothetical protein n=1 Tax=Serratia liquefaciens TaxID=614 RepID=UPI002178BFB8|nr:hypothetical protein [Serratia liquefaciens]CAI0819786.1 Uncharacterised protein [Serratia liquefaciens]